MMDLQRDSTGHTHKHIKEQIARCDTIRGGLYSVAISNLILLIAISNKQFIVIYWYSANYSGIMHKFQSMLSLLLNKPL